MVIKFQSLFQWQRFFFHNQFTPQLKSSNLNVVPRKKKKPKKNLDYEKMSTEFWSPFQWPRFSIANSPHPNHNPMT